MSDISAAEHIDGLAAEIGQWSQGKGFREDWELADELEKVAKDFDEIPGYLPDIELLRQAATVIRNNVVGTKLMLMVSELAEALETLRDVGADGVMRGEGNFIEELADTEIRIKDTAHMLGLSLGDAQVAKVAKNYDRPYKHGRQM